MGIVIICLKDLNGSMDFVQKRYEYVKFATMIRNETSNLDRRLVNLVFSETDENSQQMIQSIRESEIRATEAVNNLGEILYIEKVQELHEKLKLLHKEYIYIENEVIRLVQAGKKEEASKLMLSNALITRLQLFETIDEMNKVQEQLMADSFTRFQNTYSLSEKVINMMLIGFLIIGIFIILWIMKSIIRRLEQVTTVITSVDPCNVDHLPRIKVTTKDQIGEIAYAFNNMAQALEVQAQNEKTLKQSMLEKSWLDEKLSEITMIYQGVSELETLVKLFINKITTIVGAEFAVFYIKEDDKNCLKKLVAYADREQEVGSNSIKFGEGLVGQCAIEKRSISLTNVPNNYIKITSGLGYASPNSIILLPVEFEGEVIAVLELASFEDFSAIQRHLLEQVTKNLGTTLNSIKGQMKVKQLLEESQTLTEELQAQSEELMSQQEELKSTNEELEQQYKESEKKTKELKNIKEELEEKAREVALSSQYKSEFLANMSHELRTPLNSLLILASLLSENKENNLTKDQIEFANTIYSSGQDLLELINDILDLSKVESGKMEIYCEKVDLKDIARFSERNFLPLAEKKGLKFNIQFDNDVPDSIYTDKQRLQQILKNLLSNAFKFTGEGRVILHIRYAKKEVYTKYSNLNYTNAILAISVKDTGIGIPKEKQSIIFDAFKQADGTTSRNFGGTGLGLSICREMAHLLGGFIEIESEEGKGSIFTLYLPVYDQSAKEQLFLSGKEVATGYEETYQANESTCEIDYDEKIENEMEERSLEKNVLPQDNKVLIVDDDMRNVFALTTALESNGINTLFAENGKEGINVLMENPDINIVLMDIMMPDMDGYEAIRAIREIPEYDSLPIIALTAKAMKNDRAKCLDVGASDYISKPVNLDKLLSLIQVWMYK